MSAESESPQSAANSARWITEARGGSVQALEHLLKACYRYLLAVANLELGAALRSRLDAVDVVQDTLMKAWRYFPHFRGETATDWLAWLRKILRHNLANERRWHVQTAMRSTRREVPLREAALVQLPDLASRNAASPGRQAQAREQQEALQKAMRRLPELYRQVLHLRTHEELTFPQVGERLCCSAEAARKLWKRAADRLVQHLEDAACL